MNIMQCQKMTNTAHRSAPIRYGIDEYVDAAFLGATNEEEPKSIEEALKNKIWKEAADRE